MIKRKTIEYKNAPYSLNWRGDELIDWVGGGNVFALNGEEKRSSRYYSYGFDAAIQSKDGIYAVIYTKLGTKGLLLKNGQILRELNRSYYQASAYEYPIAFVDLPNGELGIIHCPQEYNLLEIETAERGLSLTNREERKPTDCFHSRLRLNPSNSQLISTGWVWHPYNIIGQYDIHQGLKDNTVFDQSRSNFPIYSEVSSAEFLNDDLLVIASTKEEPLEEDEATDTINLQEGQLGLYSISQEKFLKKGNVEVPLGTLIPLDENVVIDLFNYPKLIDISTGEVLQKWEDINSGKQDSAIIHHLEPIPPMAYDRINKRLAIANDRRIELLEFV